MKKIILSSVVLMFAYAGVAHAAGDAEAGKTKAAACGGCHGVDGNSMVPTFPKLAGQGELYIVKQLADFKSNTTRKNDLMLGMAAALSEQISVPSMPHRNWPVLRPLMKVIWPWASKSTRVATCLKVHRPARHAMVPKVPVLPVPAILRLAVNSLTTPWHSSRLSAMAPAPTMIKH